MPETKPSAPPRGPNCWQCQHFAVSWDPKRPYACLRMGFKSPGLPALEVLRVDGQVCRGFSTKSAAAAPVVPNNDADTAAAPRPQPSSGLWLA